MAREVQIGRAEIGPGACRLGLAVVIVVYLLFGLAYAVKVPKWNAPDEPAQYNYVKQVATTLTLPVLQVGDYDAAYLARLTTAKFPDALPVDAIRYESHQPPLFYLLAAGIYKLAEGLPLDARVLALRAFSVVLGAILLALAYALVREALPASPLLALGTAAFVAGVPQHIATTAAVNNDTLAEVVLALVLLVSLGGLRHGFSWRRCLALGLLLGLALLTKMTVYLTLGLALAALAARWHLAHQVAAGKTGPRPEPLPLGEGGEFVRAGQAAGGRSPAYVEPRVGASVLPFSPRARAGGSEPADLPRALPSITSEPALLWQLLVVYGVALAASAWWFGRNALTYGGLDIFGLVRHDAVMLDQPRTVYNLATARYFLTTTFQSFWAQFGWMGVLVDRRIYLALAGLCALALLGFALYLWHLAKGKGDLDPVEKRSLALFGLCWLLAVAALLYYNLTFLQAQGRYLFPALIAIGLFFVVGLLELVPRALRVPAMAGLYLGLLALDYVCLVRFIAPFFGTA